VRRAYGLNAGGFHGVIEVELTEAGKNWLQEHYPQGTRSKEEIKFIESFM